MPYLLTNDNHLRRHANGARSDAYPQSVVRFTPRGDVRHGGFGSKHGLRTAITKTEAKTGDSEDSTPSVRERAAELFRQQKELDEQLARLKAELSSLSPSEREEVAKLLQTTSLPNTQGLNTAVTDIPQPSKPGESAGSDGEGTPGTVVPLTVAQAFEALSDETVEIEDTNDNQDSAEQEFVEIPLQIRRMLEEAGVEGAMEWKGVPASAPIEDDYEDSDDDRVSTKKLEDRYPEAAEDVENTARNMGIPPSPEDVDDEYVDGDDDEVEPEEGVAEMVAKLERGEPLGPDPRYEGLKTESSEEFAQRMLLYKQAYEAQFLPKKDWKISEEDYKRIVNERIDENEPPWETSEITEVQPAPDWPDELHQAQYDRAQWILFLVRKAYLLPRPDAAAEFLAHAGLLSENLVYEDPMIECLGPFAYFDYATRLTAVGCVNEISHVWSEMIPEKPYPKWRVWVDVWLSIPYPRWYDKYREIHSAFDDPPNLVARSDNDAEFVDPFAPIPNNWNPPPLRYPKGRIKLSDLQQPPKPPRGPRMGEQFSAKGTTTGPARGQYSQARQEANAYERGYESPSPPAGQRTEKGDFEAERQAEEERISRLQKDLDLFVTDSSQRPTYESDPVVQSEGEAVHLGAMRECMHRASEGAASGPSAGTESSGGNLRGFQHLPADSQRKQERSRRLVTHTVEHIKGSKSKPKRPWRPSFKTVPPTPQEEILEPSKNVPSLESSRTVTLEDGVGTSRGRYTVHSYAAAKWRWPRKPAPRNEIPVWPECPDAGQAWRGGGFFCIPLTIGHVIDNDLGQVSGIHVEWGAMLGNSIGTHQDLLDVYAWQLQLWEDHNPACQRVKVCKRP